MSLKRDLLAHPARIAEEDITSLGLSRRANRGFIQLSISRQQTTNNSKKALVDTCRTEQPQRGNSQGGHVFYGLRKIPALVPSHVATPQTWSFHPEDEDIHAVQRVYLLNTLFEHLSHTASIFAQGT